MRGRSAVFVVALAASSPARAAGPCLCDTPWSFPAPPEPPEDALPDAGPLPPPHVPHNAQLFVSWMGASPEWFELSRDDGTPAAFTVEAAYPELGQFWVRPVALDAGASYTLTERDNSITFVVDEADDLVAPDHHRVLGQSARLEGRCPAHVAAEVHALTEEGDSLLGAEPYDTLYDVTVQKVGEDATLRRFFVRAGHPYFGEVLSDDYRFQACFENYQGAEPGVDYYATVTVYDQAGNVGTPARATGDLTRFRFGYNVSEGCGCRVGGRAGAGSAAAFLLLAILVIVAAAARFAGWAPRRSAAPRSESPRRFAAAAFALRLSARRSRRT